MEKLGRNEPCFCGSGLKYKKCCIGKENSQPEQQQQVSLRSEINTLQDFAEAKKEVIKNIGVFAMLSTAKGDAWLLELTDQDALLVAKDGKKINVDISESSDTIEVNWSHSFEIERSKFHTTSYADNTAETHSGFPTAQIRTAIQQINKNFSNQMLDSIHID